MKAKRSGSFLDNCLLESDVRAYFEKLLQDLSDVEEHVGRCNDKVRLLPEARERALAKPR